MWKVLQTLREKLEQQELSEVAVAAEVVEGHPGELVPAILAEQAATVEGTGRMVQRM